MKHKRVLKSKTFRESYREEIRLFHTIWIKTWIIILFVVLFFVFPLISGVYVIYIANLCLIAIIGAIGLNILSGFTGQISLGHAGFIAIGAYVSAILSTKLGSPFLLNLVLSGIAATIMGIVVGLPSLRLKGLYLAVATLAFGIIIQFLVYNLAFLTGGPSGIHLPTMEIFGMALDRDVKAYYLMLFIVIILTMIAKNIMRSKIGRAFIAIRDRDIAASIIGVNLTKYKVTSFAISSFYAGVSGSLFAYYISYVSPEDFSFFLSIEYIVMIIVGGMGSIVGSIYGAIFVISITEVLKALANMSQWLSVIYTDEMNMAFYGVLIIFFMILEKQGLYGTWNRIKIYFKTWPYKY